MTEERILGRLSLLGLLVLVAIVTSLTLPAVVQAATTTLGHESYHNKTYSLNEGDVLNWDWHVVGNGDVDFWIEDGGGTKHFNLDNATSSNSWLTIPEDGEWMYVFYNDETTGPSVTVEYEIDIVPASEAEEFLSALIWGFTLVGVVILILIIVMAWLLLRKGKPEQP